MRNKHIDIIKSMCLIFAVLELVFSTVCYVKNGILLNQYGLFNSIESVDIFMLLRNKYIEAGHDIENFWDMIPVRLSEVD